MLIFNNYGTQMNINLDEIKTYLQDGYRFTVEQGGKLGQHAVRILNQSLQYIGQDTRLSIATIAVANILFLEVASIINRLANKILTYTFGPEEGWSEKSIFANSLVSLIIISLLVAGLNILLHRNLQSFLSPVAKTAISVTTCVSYILFHVWNSHETNSKFDVKESL